MLTYANDVRLYSNRSCPIVERDGSEMSEIEATLLHSRAPVIPMYGAMVLTAGLYRLPV